MNSAVYCLKFETSIIQTSHNYENSIEINLKMDNNTPLLTPAYLG